jgi:hypothetical protein
MSETKSVREQMMDQDWLLEMLVALVDAQSVSVNITLSVGGSLVSGKLVSGKEYFNSFAEQVSSGFKDMGVSEATAKIMREQLAQPGEVFHGESTDPKLKNKPNYLHLKNARIISGTASYASQSTWWRGRLSAVEGFFLGDATPNK